MMPSRCTLHSPLYAIPHSLAGWYLVLACCFDRLTLQPAMGKEHKAMHSLSTSSIYTSGRLPEFERDMLKLVFVTT